jgi:hypothetical protein
MNIFRLISEVKNARTNKIEISKTIKEIRTKIYDNQQDLERDYRK